MKITKQEQTKRIEIANKVLATFAPNYKILKQGSLFLSWVNWRGQSMNRRWSCEDNFYPPFHEKMTDCGGTKIVAISNLVKWGQGQPCYPLRTWRYWGGETVKLWKSDEEKNKALGLLESSGYPDSTICIFCDRKLTNGEWDWYSLPHSGVGCYPACDQWQKEINEWNTKKSAQ